MDRRAQTHAKAGRPISPDPSRDMIFGHEFCGQVLAYGPDAERRFEPGTRVVALPYATGPAGRETVGFSNRFPGGYGEQVCVDAAMLMAVPDHLSDRRRHGLVGLRNGRDFRMERAHAQDRSKKHTAET